VASRSSTTPAFGKADLSNCEREQIHLAGGIQPHGALLVLREPDHVVVQASANAREFLNLGEVIGRSLDELGCNIAEHVLPHLGRELDVIPVAIRCRLGDPAGLFDGLLHRPPGGGLVIELEHAAPPVNLAHHIETAVKSILATSVLRVLADETARIFKDLTGYDRVMVYRFDEEGHGEVFSELHEPELEAYLGNRYPATDIPQIARRLYERNRVRILVDVEDVPVPLEPRMSPITGQDLDMSLCFLRSMSPIHVQYLKNMGVGATLVVSLMVGGKLWGLIACHHYEARFIPYEVRAVCELLGEVVATRIAALESFVRAHAELSVRRLEQRMVEAVSRDGDWRGALLDSPQMLLQPVGATGAALLFEGETLTAGEVPGTRELREIGTWLDARSQGTLVATAALGQDEPAFAPLQAVASGLMAAPISNSPGEYLIWFRPERVHTVTWGGNPFKPMVIGDSPADLSPRRSFAQWHQLVEQTADPWTAPDLAAAKLISDTVADVVLQFRSVRTLIAQDQLEQVSGQVRVSDQPVIIADPSGRILLANEAFLQLLPANEPRPQRVELMAGLFCEADDVRRSLADLVERRRSWRSEVRLRSDAGKVRALLARADPVLARQQRLLGFVLTFTDLTEQRAADAARQRFQEQIIERHRVMSVRLDTKADLLYRNLLSSVVGNAQLAALEITDGVDLARMPGMLESVRASVTRTSQLLEQLIWHATRETKEGG
jgi:light-regulated signal transduction histidine kinase (bacteriophytochrome)